MAEQFGPYRVVRKIATGGMAEVYLARHRGPEGVERTVVLKRILPNYTHDEEFVTMFLDEARLLAALSHPNIAHVFEVARFDETFVLVMEHVRGPTLGEMLTAASRRGMRGLPVREACGIALALAQALGYAHQVHDELGRAMQIIHRDLNPNNVIVSYDGAVKLIDFGIAKAASKVYETRTGVIKGTFGYMAPEQFTKAAPIDHRADVFALGVVMFEMLVGSHPFDASDEPGLLDRILRSSFKRPRVVNPNVPEALDRVIVSCLAPHPEGRPEDMQDLENRLVEHLESAHLVPTMSHVAQLVRALVPDTEGPMRVRPFTGPQPLRVVGGRKEGTARVGARPLARRAGAAPEGTQPVAAPKAPLVAPPVLARVDEQPTTMHDLAPPGRPSAPGRPSPAGRAGPPSIDGAETIVGRMPPEAAGPMSYPELLDEPTIASSPGRRLPARKPPLGVLAGVAAVAALVLGLGVVGVVRLASDDEPDEARDAGAAVVRRPPQKKTRPATAPPRRDSGPPVRMLHVVSEPPGAAVLINGTLVPGVVTPAAVRVPEDASFVLVQLELDGYQPVRREVASGAGEAFFELEMIVEIVDDGGTEMEIEEPERPPRRR
ncbi:MAG: protein kinase, partial [Deltaproteobacteria bacterium]|nr:protein kinase [Deltaproteobacteria bacterium]